MRIKYNNKFGWVAGVKWIGHAVERNTISQIVGVRAALQLKTRLHEYIFNREFLGSTKILDQVFKK